MSCTSGECTLYAHCIVIKSDNIMFRFPEFHGLSCFDIAHQPSAAGLWTSNPNHKVMLGRAQADERNKTGSDIEQSDESEDDKGNGRKKLPCAYNVNTLHSLYIHLRNEYGRNTISRVKGAKMTAEDEEVENQEEKGIIVVIFSNKTTSAINLYNCHTSVLITLCHTANIYKCRTKHLF